MILYCIRVLSDYREGGNPSGYHVVRLTPPHLHRNFVSLLFFSQRWVPHKGFLKESWFSVTTLNNGLCQNLSKNVPCRETFCCIAATVAVKIHSYPVITIVSYSLTAHVWTTENLLHNLASVQHLGTVLPANDLNPSRIW